MKHLKIEEFEPAESDTSADRPRLPDPAGPPLPNASHPLASLYCLPSYCSLGHEEPAAANSGRYL
jgi:hypothetical protein